MTQPRQNAAELAERQPFRGSSCAVGRPPLVTASVGNPPPAVAVFAVSPSRPPACPAVSPATCCAAGATVLATFPPVFPAAGTAFSSVWPPDLPATPVTFWLAPSTALPTLAPSRAVSPLRFGVAGRGGRTGGAGHTDPGCRSRCDEQRGTGDPAGQGRDMMLLVLISGLGRSDYRSKPAKVAERQRKELAMRRIISYG